MSIPLIDTKSGEKNKVLSKLFITHVTNILISLSKKQKFVKHKTSCLPWYKVLFPHYKSKRQRKIINKKDGEKEVSYISFKVQFFMHYFIIVDRSCTLTVRHGHIYVEKKTVLIVSLLNTTHSPIINTHTHTHMYQ
jgi:hypothetical protein